MAARTPRKLQVSSSIEEANDGKHGVNGGRNEDLNDALGGFLVSGWRRSRYDEQRL